MGLEKIRQAVLVEAKTEATHIIDSAKKTAASLLKSQKGAAEQEHDRHCRLRMQAIEDEVNRKLIQFKGAAGKQVLDKRNALLKSLFENAKMEILTWPPERYARVMGRIIEKVAGGYAGMLRVHAGDKDVFTKVLSKLNEGRGVATITLDPSHSLPERGGFIFASADFEVDQTLETILKEIEHDLLPAIAADLFPEK
jgi:vacuolar-type H+-ATPase subunit E/Vma4